MATTYHPTVRAGLHPLHAFLLAGIFPLFLGALLSDLAYASSHQVQWINFSSWLIAGGLVFGGFVLVWAVVDLVRKRPRALLHLLMVLATWIAGFVNALIHARDAWAIMPSAPVLSAIALVLAIITTWFAFSSIRAGGVA